MSRSHYNRTQLADALEEVGLRRGDVVFSHSNIGYFGVPEEGSTPAAVFETILGAFQDVVGPDGVLVVPTFTYSFTKGQPFDVERSPSVCGMFTEMLRARPGAERSVDPIFSVAAVGRRAKDFTAGVSAECFGPDSFWDRFLSAGGMICNLNFDAGSTFVHYVERRLNVPYRYDKLFVGKLIERGQWRRATAIFFCQDPSNPDTVADFTTLDKVARARGVARVAPVGRGAVLGADAADVFWLIQEELKENPWLLTVAAVKGKTPTPALEAPVAIATTPGASTAELVAALRPLPRDVVSDGCDAALRAVASHVPLRIYSYPTGTRCWSWVVPEKWTCREAYLETIDGRRLFSHEENPRHVASYSQPFEGEISREELLAHLEVDASVQDETPFSFKYYERDWGLCCSAELKAALDDERYRVVIKSSFSYGVLKVGEAVARGERSDCVLLCAHLGPGARSAAELVGLAAGIEVFKELMKRGGLKYTYRLLVTPETVGTAAQLSMPAESVKWTLFLDALEVESLAHVADPDGRSVMQALYNVDPSADPVWPLGGFLRRSTAAVAHEAFAQIVEARRDSVMRAIELVEKFEDQRPERNEGHAVCVGEGAGNV